MDTEASKTDPNRNATPAPRPSGRPGLCTEAALKRLLQAVRQDGLSDASAALRAGISPPTFKRHKRKDPGIIYAVLAAREEFRATQKSRIHKSAEAPGAQGWRAAAYLLERVFPEDYGRTGKVGAQERGLQELEEAELRQAAAEINARYGDPQPTSAEPADSAE